VIRSQTSELGTDKKNKQTIHTHKEQEEKEVESRTKEGGTVRCGERERERERAELGTSEQVGRAV
jgi:hypothetical protein